MAKANNSKTSKKTELAIEQAQKITPYERFYVSSTKGLTLEQKQELSTHYRFQDVKFFNEQGIQTVGSLNLIRRLQSKPTTLTLVLNSDMLTELSVKALKEGLTSDEFIRVKLAELLDN